MFNISLVRNVLLNQKNFCSYPLSTFDLLVHLKSNTVSGDRSSYLEQGMFHTVSYLNFTKTEEKEYFLLSTECSGIKEKTK